MCSNNAYKIQDTTYETKPQTFNLKHYNIQCAEIKHTRHNIREIKNKTYMKPETYKIQDTAHEK